MSDQKYTPFNIYQKRKMSESATPLKSIYAKNHNMFMNAVPEARDGMDRGFITGGGEAKRARPIINKNKDDKQNELKKTNLTVDLDGDNNSEDKD
jgi:hypothetical protein